jgi:hypothetical protein
VTHGTKNPYIKYQISTNGDMGEMALGNGYGKVNEWVNQQMVLSSVEQISVVVYVAPV